MRQRVPFFTQYLARVGRSERGHAPAAPGLSCSEPRRALSTWSPPERKVQSPLISSDALTLFWTIWR
jgi:hypothetical protein